MQLPTFQAELVRTTQLTHDVREFLFRPMTGGLRFKAGQYVDLVISGDGEMTPGVRAYSIFSPPEESQQLTIVANHVPGGKGTGYLFSLHEGTQVTMRGPRGHFVVDERGVRDYLFVATGTGIAPLHSMVRHLLALGTPRHITMYWGLRSPADLYYQTELTEYMSRYPNFRAITTLSQPEPGWTGASGRVTQLIEAQIARVDQLDVYVCGSQAMIQDVKNVLRTKGLCPVHTEKFY